MKKVVFICRRNRFRSQIAEGLYNSLAKNGSVGVSCGSLTLPEERDILFKNFERVNNTILAMKNHGIDISKNYVKQLTPEILKDAGKIIILTDKKDIPDWVNEYPHEYWEAIDYPGKPTLEESEETIQTLEQQIKKLLNI